MPSDTAAVLGGRSAAEALPRPWPWAEALAPATPAQPPKHLSDRRIAEVLEECGTPPVRELRSVARSDRLFSAIWFVTAAHDGGEARYMLKHPEYGAERPVALSQRADAIFAGDAAYFSAQLREHGESGLIVSRIYDGRSLGDRLGASRRSNPFAWPREFQACLTGAARWLARYHSVERRVESVSGPLRTYVGARRAEFAALPAEPRRKLERLLSDDIRDETVVVHGDFSPQNILTDGDTLCVIDFGIREWRRMSPWWDVLTLTAILERHLLFDNGAFGAWLRPSLPRLRKAFLEAYGAAPDERAPAVRACRAVRHFSLMGTVASGSFGRSRRSLWHLRRLSNILAS